MMEAYSLSQKLQECAIPYEETTCKMKLPVVGKRYWKCIEMCSYTGYVKNYSISSNNLNRFISEKNANSYLPAKTPTQE